MKPVLFAASLLALCGSAAAFDTEAQKILGKGRWGLITSDLSEAAVAEARTCAGTAIAFAFTASEIQRITFENGKPPAGPPDSFADVAAKTDAPYTVITLYTGKHDAAAAASYTYDPGVDTLMLMGPDGDGTHLYALCPG